MHASPRSLLILSLVAAIEATKGSKCHHGRSKNSHSAVIDPFLASSKYASEVVSSVVTPSVETSQVVSNGPIIPTEVVNNNEDAKVQETVTSSQRTASSPIVQPKGSIMAALQEPTKRFCGKPNESEVLFGTPWIVFSMNYNYQSIKGSSCVGYYDYTGSGDDQTIHWSVLWDIDPKVGTNLVKGYNFIGLTQGLETRLSDIKSIPSKYEWVTKKSSEYKGV